LHRYLQTQKKDDVAQALEAIQSGAGPSQVMEALKSGASSNVGPNNTIDRLNDLITNHTADTVPSRDRSSLQGDLSEPSRRYETEISSTVTSPFVHAVLQPSEVIVALVDGVDAFFSCTGCVFHIYDQHEAHRLLSTIWPHIRDADANWPQSFLRDSPLIQLKASLCSVCIMAAVGLQHTTNAAPAPHLDASVERGMGKYITIFYELTKHLMEVVIENDGIEGMKVCAAVCVFNSIEHATIALAYAGTWSGLRICVTSIDCILDMGINLALSSRSVSYPISLENTAWADYKRVLRTLVSLRRYVELLIFDCMTFPDILKLAYFHAGIYAR
jgi:hypothetical protein